MRKNDPWRQYLLGLLRYGEISIAGAAFIAGVTKQAVSRWCARAKISVKEAERARWVRLRARGQRALTRTSGPDVAVRRRTKADLREQATAAKAKWDERNGRLS